MATMISGTITDGVIAQTEYWHWQREGARGPMCGVSLSGRIKVTSKGYVNCSRCRQLEQFGRLAYDERILLDRVSKESVSRSEMSPYNSLIEQDLVFWSTKKTRYILTSRGTLCLKDCRNPAHVIDSSRLLHARLPLHTHTMCGVVIIPSTTTCYADALQQLHDEAKKLKRRTPTCMRCIGSPWWNRVDVD